MASTLRPHQQRAYVPQNKNTTQRLVQKSNNDTPSSRENFMNIPMNHRGVVISKSQPQQTTKEPFHEEEEGIKGYNRPTQAVLKRLGLYERAMQQREERSRKVQAISQQMMQNCTFNPQTYAYSSNRTASTGVVTQSAASSKASTPNGSHESVFDRLYAKRPNNQDQQKLPKRTPSTISKSNRSSLSPGDGGSTSWGRSSVMSKTPTSGYSSEDTSGITWPHNRRLEEIYQHGVRKMRRRPQSDDEEKERRERRRDESEMLECTFKPQLVWGKSDFIMSQVTAPTVSFSHKSASVPPRRRRWNPPLSPSPPPPPPSLQQLQLHPPKAQQPLPQQQQEQAPPPQSQPSTILTSVPKIITSPEQQFSSPTYSPPTAILPGEIVVPPKVKRINKVVQKKPHPWVSPLRLRRESLQALAKQHSQENQTYEKAIDNEAVNHDGDDDDDSVVTHTGVEHFSLVSPLRRNNSPSTASRSCSSSLPPGSSSTLSSCSSIARLNIPSMIVCLASRRRPWGKSNGSLSGHDGNDRPRNSSKNKTKSDHGLGASNPEDEPDPKQTGIFRISRHDEEVESILLSLGTIEKDLSTEYGSI